MYIAAAPQDAVGGVAAARYACDVTWASALGSGDATRYKDFGGEVVGVSVEVYSGGEGAQGVVLACAFGVFEEVAVEDFGTQEVPAVFGRVEQVAGNDNLVKEVPRALVGKSSGAVVEDAPEGAEECVVFGDVFLVAFGTEDFGA